MRPTLNIVVSCTDTKKSAARIRLRDIPPADIATRVDLWWERLLEAQDEGVPAVDLYAGGIWSVVRGLPQIASQAGYKPRLWVISAGHGLVPADSVICSYSATFSSTHEDSVLRIRGGVADRSRLLGDWWDGLATRRHPAADEPRSLAELADATPTANFLVLASAEYLQPIAGDLSRAVSRLRDPNSLVLVSNPDRARRLGLASHVVPSDPRLQARSATGQRSIGGSRIALHAHVARLILERIADGSWTWGASEVKGRLDQLVKSSPPLARYGRSPLTDEQVLAFIRRRTASSTVPSCASLLRELRDGGSACEQKRFRGLYQSEAPAAGRSRGRR